MVVGEVKNMWEGFLGLNHKTRKLHSSEASGFSTDTYTTQKAVRLSEYRDQSLQEECVLTF